MTNTGMGGPGFSTQPQNQQFQQNQQPQQFLLQNQQPQQQAPPQKNRKKGCACGCLVAVVAAILLILGVGLVVLLLLPDEESEQVTAIYDPEVNATKTTELVQELAAGGSALTPDYAGGEFGIWGLEQSAQAEGAGKLRPHYVNPEGAQKVTVMVYMIGSDLESEGGAATSDLKEMINSKNGENLQIVVQTGGAKKWQNDFVSPDTRQRFLIQNGEMELLEDVGKGTMISRESVRDFIDWSARTCPADRYMLVFWDHGGGLIGGYGQDESDEDATLYMEDLTAAVRDSGVTFDLVSFDACLMGSLEVGYGFEPYADYLLASEEMEPGDGWYYTNAFSELSKRPDMSTLEFGARVIDDYHQFYEQNNIVTLSLTDLRELPGLYEQYVAYYQAALDQLTVSKDSFRTFSTARSKSRSFADGTYEQIDLVDFVQRTDVEGAEALIRGTFSAVKYRNAAVGAGSYGLATYFPYEEPDYYQDIMSDLKAINCDGAQPFFNQFLSILTAGNGGSQSIISQLTGETEAAADYSGESWYDPNASEGYDYNVIADADELVINYDEKEEAYLLHLEDSEWDNITDIQLQVYYDDGEGYIDLGSDQLYDWTEKGDLILDFDNTWTSIDGNLVAFYALEPREGETETTFTGTTPALLNEKTDIDLYLQWVVDQDGNSEGKVLGYRPQTNGNQPMGKGYLPLKEGDVIQPTCDFYTYEGDYEDSYYFGDPITVTSMEDLEVGSYDLEDATTLCWFQLTDLYNQYWYTESVEISYTE